MQGNLCVSRRLFVKMSCDICTVLYYQAASICQICVCDALQVTLFVLETHDFEDDADVTFGHLVSVVV